MAQRNRKAKISSNAVSNKALLKITIKVVFVWFLWHSFNNLQDNWRRGRRLEEDMVRPIKNSRGYQKKWNRIGKNSKKDSPRVMCEVFLLDNTIAHFKMYPIQKARWNLVYLMKQLWWLIIVWSFVIPTNFWRRINSETKCLSGIRQSAILWWMS